MDTQNSQEQYGYDKQLLSHIYSLKKLRENYEPQFYLARKAYEGKHFTYWNRTTQQLAEVPVKKTVFNQLPEVSKQADSFENFLVSTDFSFTVVPKLLSDQEAMKQSMSLSLLARDYHKRLQGSQIYADFVHNALLDNVSFFEVSPNDQMTDVEYRSFDAFDIIFNPTIKDWKKQKLVVKVVRRKKSELAKSKLYHLPDNYQGGGDDPFISWKDIFEQEKYTNFVKLEKDEMVIFECYMLDDVDGLTIKTLDGTGRIIRNDHYKQIKSIPIFPLRIFSGEWYQPSYVYRLIPVNRSMDLMFSRMEDLLLRLAKGGWIMQEEENINGGMDEDIGQIFRYAAVKPEQMEMPQIPNFLLELFNTTVNMSERYGFSQLFSGTLPQGSSGIRTDGMLESMTGLTQQNNTAPINNLRAAVKQILEFTFLFLYEMWDTPRQAIYTDFTQLSPSFVSAKYKNLYNDSSVAIPSSFTRFDVEVDDGLGYTLEKRKDTAIALKKMGILGDAALRQIFKLGSSAYLIEAEEPLMADTPDFKQLVANFPNMSDDQKQALITTLKTMGMQTSGNPAATPAPGGTTMPQTGTDASMGMKGQATDQAMASGAGLTPENLLTQTSPAK